MAEIILLELEGNSREIGRLHGEKLKDMIAELYNKYMDCTVKQSYIPTSEKELLQLAMRNLEFARDYAPDLFEEMLGIADGSGLPVDKIMFLNNILEGLDLIFPAPAASVLKGPILAPLSLCCCTSFGAAGNATVDGKALIAQNYDMQADIHDYAVLLKIKKDKKTLLLFTFAGMIGCQGLSSARLAIVINKVIAKDVRAGVPYTFVVRKALEQENLAEALSQIIFAERAAGTNFVLADEHTVIDIETTAQKFEVLTLPDNIVTHANHYKSDRLKDIEANDRLGADSYVRDASIYRRVKDNHGAIDIYKAQEMLSDHSGFPHSLCKHQPEGAPHFRSHRTILSMICVPSALKSWICWGNPCETEYKEYSLL